LTGEVTAARWTPDLEHDLVVHDDNLSFLATLPDDSFPLLYIDPPFNTGSVQRRTTLRTARDDDGDRIGFGGKRFRTTRERVLSYADAFDDYVAFLEPRLCEAHRVLAPNGTLYVHLDFREVHYARLLLDEIFGRECLLNEIIWAYDYGARPKRRWPAKHDNILVYVKDPANYHFDASAVEREPYMAPGLVTAEKAARGKLPTDVWWHTIVSPTGKEKTGYPTQKPEGVLRRIVQASSRPGDWVLDFFAGSGTTGAVARQLDRRFVLVDDNPEAIAVMEQRLGVTPITGSAPPSRSAIAP
jgi:site-specific DNA-methyltransferase (adenine-specific)